EAALCTVPPALSVTHASGLPSGPEISNDVALGMAVTCHIPLYADGVPPTVFPAIYTRLLTAKPCGRVVVTVGTPAGQLMPTIVDLAPTLVPTLFVVQLEVPASHVHLQMYEPPSLSML